MAAQPLSLRAATGRDIPLVLSFWATAAEDSHRPTDDALKVAALIDRDPDALGLAFDGDLLVGSLIAGWDGWRFHLYRLAVHPAYRRRGIADRLVSGAEERMARAGVSRADAMVLDENADARDFWASRGYGPQAEWSRWVKPLLAE